MRKLRSRARVQVVTGGFTPSHWPSDQIGTWQQWLAIFTLYRLEGQSVWHSSVGYCVSGLGVRYCIPPQGEEKGCGLFCWPGANADNAKKLQCWRGLHGWSFFDGEVVVMISHAVCALSPSRSMERARFFQRLPERNREGISRYRLSW